VWHCSHGRGKKYNLEDWKAVDFALLKRWSRIWNRKQDLPPVATLLSLIRDVGPFGGSGGQDQK
jgi:hypothetical protein